MLGIGEPLMYAVTLPLGKPFITACMAPVLARDSYLFHLVAISQGVSGLFDLLIVQPGNGSSAPATMLLAYAAGRSSGSSALTRIVLTTSSAVKPHV